MKNYEYYATQEYDSVGPVEQPKGDGWSLKFVNTILDKDSDCLTNYYWEREVE